MSKQDNYSQSTGAQQGSSVSEALESSELCKVAHVDEGQRVYQVLPQVGHFLYNMDRGHGLH